MKTKVIRANEAPEKLYIDFRDRAESTWRCAYAEKAKANDIEYTRTDTIIEKACELLVDCIEDFMARRMEMWDEECKKQTLENLRNALKE